jgi:ubiquinone biosynthesis protein
MIYGSKKPDSRKIQKMGLLAVKIGQVHALRVDFLSEETCFELSKLYRSNTPIGLEDLLHTMDRKPFDWIDEKPIASASVGQVYRARLKTGQDVVIKIIKSNFKAAFEKDVASVRRFFKFIILFYPKLARVFNPLGILEHIEEYTLRELNLLNEIEGHKLLEKIYLENIDNPLLSSLRFPKIYYELSSENILVAEYIPGQTFDEILDTSLDYRKLLLLFQIHGFFMFKIGTFHGDIHPGNLMLSGDNIYLVDTGAIGRVSSKLRLGLLDFFEALSVYDYEKSANCINNMAEIKLEEDRLILFTQKFKLLYADFKGKSVNEISLTKKMMETIKLGVNSGMAFEKGMFSIIKSLMFLDGMVLRCNPNALLLEDMREFISQFKSEINSGN